MDKGHIQVHRRGNPVQDTALGGGVRRGADLNGVVAGRGNHIIAQCRQGLADLRHGHFPQVLVAVQLKPEQQRFLRKHILLQGAQLGKGIPKVGKIGTKGPAFLLRPLLPGLLAQAAQQLGVMAGPAELHRIEPAGLEEIQKFIIRLDSGVVGLVRQNSFDYGRNPGRAEVTQHADPLVALLDVEIAQILVAGDGIPDAHVSQMGGAQIHPFPGKLRFGVQQRQKARRKGSDPAGRLGTDNTLRRNLQQSQLLHHLGPVFRENLIQNRGVCCFSLGGQLTDLPLAQFKGPVILFRYHLCRNFHDAAPFVF